MTILSCFECFDTLSGYTINIFFCVVDVCLALPINRLVVVVVILAAFRNHEL